MEHFFFKKKIIFQLIKKKYFLKNSPKWRAKIIENLAVYCECVCVCFTVLWTRIIIENSMIETSSDITFLLDCMNIVLLLLLLLLSALSSHSRATSSSSTSSFCGMTFPIPFTQIVTHQQKIEENRRKKSHTHTHPHTRSYTGCFN